MGNEGRSGGPQGSKSTRSSEEPQLARSYTLPLRLVLRASIVRLAAAGRTNASIADRLNVKVDNVRRWRARFAARRLDGLADAPRSGRPPRFSALQRAEVTALACQVPATSGVPLARWSCPELAAQLTDTEVVPAISAATVRRILREDAIKPWQYRSWISVRDPDVSALEARVLGLYQRSWQGRELGADEYVISADEKTSIQAYPGSTGERP